MLIAYNDTFSSLLFESPSQKVFDCILSALTSCPFDSYEIARTITEAATNFISIYCENTCAFNFGVSPCFIFCLAFSFQLYKVYTVSLNIEGRRVVSGNL